MLMDDFPRFETAIRKLEGIYSKKIADDAVQAYWRALKDLPFQQVEERINSHTRYGKFFPKPAELRPREEKPPVVADAVAFKHAEGVAAKNLETLKHEDYSKWSLEVRLRRADRILATTPADADQHRLARLEAEKLRPLVRGY
jgi:hypothetical protein